MAYVTELLNFLTDVHTDHKMIIHINPSRGRHADTCGLAGRPDRWSQEWMDYQPDTIDNFMTPATINHTSVFR
jgi:hypothetical protein